MLQQHDMAIARGWVVQQQHLTNLLMHCHAQGSVQYADVSRSVLTLDNP